MIRRGACMHHVGIIGVGSYVPERVLTNHDLERMVDTSDQWISAPENPLHCLVVLANLGWKLPELRPLIV